MINLQECSFQYTERSPSVFANMNIDLQENRALLLMGGNGSGKTTMLKVMAGISPKFTGGILSGNRRSDLGLDDSIDPRQMGVVFHGLNQQFIHARVDQEILHVLENHIEERNVQDHFQKVTTDFAVQGLLKKNIETLSSGELQLLKIVLAFALSPRVIIMDEPLAHLDHQQKIRILHILKEKMDLHRLGYAIADHDEEPWRIFGDRLTIHDLGNPSQEKQFGDIQAFRKNSHQEKILTVNDLSFSHAQTSLLIRQTRTVHKGDYIAISGRNGTGKTTFLQLLQGHLKPQEGRIQRHIPSMQSRMQVNPIQHNFFSMRLSEELKLSQAKSPEDIFRMAGLNDRYVQDLSQGEMRKAAFTVLLHPASDILLLDEPFLHLDSGSRNRLEKELYFLREKGTAIIFTTHEPNRHEVDQLWNLEE